MLPVDELLDDLLEATLELEDLLEATLELEDLLETILEATLEEVTTQGPLLAHTSRTDGSSFCVHQRFSYLTPL